MTAEEKTLLLDRLQNVLSEHCEGWVIAVEVQDGPDLDATSTLHTWGGGFNRALGLAHRLARRMEAADEETNNQPPDDGEEWKGATA